MRFESSGCVLTSSFKIARADFVCYLGLNKAPGFSYETLMRRF